MKPLTTSIFILTLCNLMFNNAVAQTVTFSSGPYQVALLELYTSEGCSSCPPADRWLSQFKHDVRLWSEIVPIAFHVDYWDYLGWKDRFSSPVYSLRQRNYAKNRNISSVYTPGFVLNGREWRTWFSVPKLKLNDKTEAGILRVAIKDQLLTATFKPSKPYSSPLSLYVAELGFNLTTDVRNGENHGKSLNHDFVVINLQTYKSKVDKHTHHWSSERMTSNFPEVKQRGLAVWVTRNDDPTPLQATGNWMNNPAN